MTERKMAEMQKKPALRLLFLISTPKLAAKASEQLAAENVPMQHLFRAHGTASSEIMDMLGLGSTEKTVLMSMMPKRYADKMIVRLRRQLQLGSVNSGVAFTIAISGCGAKMTRLIETLDEQDAPLGAEPEGKTMTENRYAMILAIVDQGYSEDVMCAARGAGATGGTVFNTRSVSGEAVGKFWGASVQEVREVVMILAEKEYRLPIIRAIEQQCGVSSPAHGVARSLPVDAAAGLG